MKGLTILEFAKLKKVSAQTVRFQIRKGNLETQTLYGGRVKLIVMNKKAREWKTQPGRRTDLE